MFSVAGCWRFAAGSLCVCEREREGRNDRERGNESCFLLQVAGGSQQAVRAPDSLHSSRHHHEGKSSKNKTMREINPSVEKKNK